MCQRIVNENNELITLYIVKNDILIIIYMYLATFTIIQYMYISFADCVMKYFS